MHHPVSLAARLPGWLGARFERGLRAVRLYHCTWQYGDTTAQLHQCCVKVSPAPAFLRRSSVNHTDRVQASWASSPGTEGGPRALSLVFQPVSVDVARTAKFEDQLGLDGAKRPRKSTTATRRWGAALAIEHRVAVGDLPASRFQRPCTPQRVLDPRKHSTVCVIFGRCRDGTIVRATRVKV